VNSVTLVACPECEGESMVALAFFTIAYLFEWEADDE
jgi:hypothetical protein